MCSDDTPRIPGDTHIETVQLLRPTQLTPAEVAVAEEVLKAVSSRKYPHTNRVERAIRALAAAWGLTLPEVDDANL